MRTILVLILWLVGGLIIGFLFWFLPSKLFPRYTAETFIRVLPASQNISNQASIYTASAAALIKSQNALDSLVNSEKIQQTDWFSRLGANKDQRLTTAVADLKRHLNAKAVTDSDLVAVSMTTRDGQEAAIILNDIVDLFIKRQQAAERKRITTNLSRLVEQEVRIQRDLEQAERASDDIRRRYGFSDLEQQSYPDPVTTRLMELQRQEDDYAIEIKQLQTQLGESQAQPQSTQSGTMDTKSADDVKDLLLRLKLLQGDLVEIRKMKEETMKQYNEFNLARAQYAQRLEIRDERRQTLDSVKGRIEELKILLEDPDACGMQFVESAETPRQPDMQPWKTVISTTAIAAIIMGMIQLWFAGQAIGKK